ncbi:MAG TPA: hypothetical protein DCP97_05660 [Ruminococcaceae bacterium]|nr:hypothetical protein [Oscillospiraceae bacterium]
MVITMDGAINDFINPPAQNRIVPFWFWNGDMDRETIKKQLWQMKEKGLGGVFICARQGLGIPYLSQKWFDTVKFASKTAEEYGLNVWLYDEYPYPSGMSGGEVMLRHPEAEHTVLQLKTYEISGGDIDIKLPWAKVLYAAALPVIEDKADMAAAVDLMPCIGIIQEQEIYQQTGLTAYNNKRFFSYGPKKHLACTLPSGKWRVEIYIQEPVGDFKYYGCFFDPFNQQAVKTFIDTTHEQYKKYMGSEFGKNIKGMFSDEVGPLGRIPWSSKLPEYFYEKNGYDIIANLPALHDSSYPNAYKIRYDMYQAAHELFTNSYHKQVAEWCGNNKLMLATEVPSFRMSTQQHSDAIGGDTCHEKLGKSLEWIYDAYLRNYRSNAKAVSSLARQLDKKYAMIESFHSVGWTMTLQDAKWMIDRMGASGINLYVFHAFYYTIQSIAKHDAPPSQFWQNPYWKHYRLLADYAGRMSAFVSNTESACNIAVLDPVPSFWTYLCRPAGSFAYSGCNENEKQELERLVSAWVAICKSLLFAQLDYEHLDAEILEKAVVKDGALIIGRAVYNVLVLPPMAAVEIGATRKIKEFLACGGKVIAQGMLPHRIIDEDTEVKQQYEEMFGINASTDGISQNGGAYFISGMPDEPQHDTENKLLALCKKLAQPEFNFEIDDSQKKSFIASVRKDSQGGSFLLICNQGGCDTFAAISFSSGKRYFAELYSLENGSTTPLKMQGEKLLLDFCPYESKLMRLSHIKNGKPEDAPKSVITVPTNRPMQVGIDGGNIFRFAEFEVSRDMQSWKKTEPKTFIEQYAGLKEIQKNDIKFDGVFGTSKKISMQYPIILHYRLSFELDSLPKELAILMDKRTISGKYKLHLNEKEIDNSKFRPIFVNDQNNILCDISGLVKTGKNELLFKVDIEEDWDGIRDNIYLYGDFGVVQGKNGWLLTKQPQKAVITNTFIQGFPFYSGTFTFQSDFEVELDKILPEFILRFDFGNTIFDCIQASVNGIDLGVRAFTPYEWKGAKQMLKNGKNSITIKITNTLANMLDGTYFDYTAHKLVSI